jgi:hypothetical protein
MTMTMSTGQTKTNNVVISREISSIARAPEQSPGEGVLFCTFPDILDITAREKLSAIDSIVVFSKRKIKY